jgi:hypothetical protein
MLQPQGASRGCRAEERLGGWTQAQEGDLGCRPRANTPRRPPIGIGRVCDPCFKTSQSLRNRLLDMAQAHQTCPRTGQITDTSVDQLQCRPTPLASRRFGLCEPPEQGQHEQNRVLRSRDGGGARC